MIKQYVEKNQLEMINHLINLINIPTLRDEPQPNAPFGKNIKIGLDYVLELASSWGMNVKNYDGYVGEINIGNGDYIIGILGHIDVVPVGDGWNTDPFNAQIINNKIYGRGSMDDKAPLISCLYALKYLKDKHLVADNVTYRMIIGTNEEEDWLCMKHYLNVADRLPDVSIVPDASFPAIFCEKGLLDFNLYHQFDKSFNQKMKIITIEGGTARNVVPERAKCIIETYTDELSSLIMSLNNIDGVTVEQNENIWTISTLGRSCHAMSPEKGINAISMLMKALGKLENHFPLSDLVNTYNNAIGFAYNGEKYHCYFEDDVSGKLTFNIGEINFNDNIITLVANLRYPASCSTEDVINAVETNSNSIDLKFEQVDHIGPICVDVESDLIKKIMSAYIKVTGDVENKPFSIGGATYARAIPNAIAFGPLFPWEEELAHEDNEFQDIESFKKMTYIYADALELLGQR